MVGRFLTKWPYILVERTGLGQWVPGQFLHGSRGGLLRSPVGGIHDSGPDRRFEAGGLTSAFNTGHLRLYQGKSMKKIQRSFVEKASPPLFLLPCYPLDGRHHGGHLLSVQENL